MAKRILIAEDEKALSHALQLKLQNEGFEVDVAGDGEEALAKIAKGNYALLILDIMMPKMDGFTVLSHLRQAGNMIPVLIASNLSQGEDEKRVRELGANDYVIKSDAPLTQIVEKVRKLIH